MPPLVNHFIKSPEFLTVGQIVDHARAPSDQLGFASLSPDQLDHLADSVQDAVRQYRASQGLNPDDIPWIGLPKTFWYWTANMWHYNKALVIMPCAITEPDTAEKVRVAVEIAKWAKVQVQARAGGHSYGGYGWGGRDGAFVIGLKSLNQIVVDKAAQTASIGPGALLGDVTKVLHRAGFMTPHGVCPQVGVGGHATIGGQGPSSRLYGMMVDQIVSFDIVLANGQYVQNVTQDHPQYADLFWAVRGAAASFGVVTKLVFKIYPDLTSITHWTYEIVNGTPEQLSNAYDQFQAWAVDPKLSRKFASTCIITDGRLAVERTFFGSEKELDAEEDSDKFRAALDVEGVKVKVQKLNFDNYKGALIHWLEDRALSLGGGIPAKFYVKSLVLRADQVITPQLSTKLFNYIHDNQPKLALWFILSDLQGGRSNDSDLAKTSCFGHRNGMLFFQFYAIDPNLLTPTFSPEIKRFIEGMYNVVKDGIPNLQVRVYPGYVDPELGPDCEEIYWGDNAQELRRLKAKYDPDNMFANPQSVRPPA